MIRPHWISELCSKLGAFCFYWLWWSAPRVVAEEQGGRAYIPQGDWSYASICRAALLRLLCPCAVVVFVCVVEPPRRALPPKRTLGIRPTVACVLSAACGTVPVSSLGREIRNMSAKNCLCLRSRQALAVMPMWMSCRVVVVFDTGQIQVLAVVVSSLCRC